MTNVLNRRIRRRLAPSTRAIRMLVAVATAGLVATACDVHGVSEPGAVTSLSITPNPVTLAVGATQQFTLVAKDFSGAVVTSTSPTWAVAAGGGTIAPSGLFTAGTVPGAFANTVTATLDGVTATATVNVVAGALASITVTPNPATMSVGATQQFTAVGKDAAGNVVTIVPSWSVVASGGSINPTSGLFTAGNTSGTFTNTVRASVGTIAGTATVNVTAGALTTITVTPPSQTLQTGATQQYTAVGRDANGNVVAISPVWSVVNGGGTINATGLFTAGSTAGTYSNTIKATSGTVSGTASVIVSAGANPNLLGSAAPNGIMAGTAFTCVTNGTINADIAISPGSTVTGFPPCVITGVQHLADAVAAQAQLDLTTAYNDLAGRPCPPANIITSDIGGTTKSAGVYCSSTTIGVTGNLTLDGGGDPNATFVFQAGSGLTTAGNVLLINGAQAKNVYWQVGSSATIGTASQWKGNIVALTSITLVDNANLIGRALARNGAVSLGTNNVVTLP
jgi:hypothetical protein